MLGSSAASRGERAQAAAQGQEASGAAKSTSMRYEYLIGLRYLRARRRERFVSLIAVISLAGVAIGTFALTVVLSVMSGFQEDLRGRLLAFNPEITVDGTGQQSELDNLQRNISAIPGIAAVAPFTTSQVLRCPLLLQACLRTWQAVLCAVC